MMALVAGLVAQHGAGTSALQHALGGLAPYRSRGKGKGRTHDNGGTRAYQRAALKARNVKRHRKACHG
jgi:hypothetical protein